MDDSSLTDTAVETGRITIQIMLGQHGSGMAYDLEGLTPEAAIGYLVALTDRIRDNRRFSWDDGCGDPDCENCNPPEEPDDELHP